MELAKKISPKTVIGGKSAVIAAVKKGGGKVDLFHVVGMAIGTKTGETNLGQWTALRGSFEAVVCETGEVIRSPVCFLPDVALDMILGSMGQGHPVNFALLIGARDPVGEENTAYVYTCTPLAEIAGADVLADMRQLLPEATKAQPDKPAK